MFKYENLGKGFISLCGRAEARWVLLDEQDWWEARLDGDDHGTWASPDAAIRALLEAEEESREPLEPVDHGSLDEWVVIPEQEARSLTRQFLSQFVRRVLEAGHLDVESGRLTPDSLLAVDLGSGSQRLSLTEWASRLGITIEE